MPETQRIALLMTSFNRRDVTLKCLGAVGRQVLPRNVVLETYLLDDASTDGTADAVQSAFPDVRVLTGNGAHYWAGGMRKAWVEALKGDYDHYVWLNDDTILHQFAISRLLETYVEQLETRTIIVGSTEDPDTGSLTYGGVVRDSVRLLRFDLVPPSDRPQRCETMNGNCVLVPSVVVAILGTISEEYTHSMGDFDYGLRASKHGVAIVIAPGFVGTCKRNMSAGTWRDSSLTRRERWQKVRGIKGLPLREWRVFSRRHGGPFWPLYWLSPYLRILVRR